MLLLMLLLQMQDVFGRHVWPVINHKVSPRANLPTAADGALICPHPPPAADADGAHAPGRGGGRGREQQSYHYRYHYHNHNYNHNHNHNHNLCWLWKKDVAHDTLRMGRGPPPSGAAAIDSQRFWGRRGGGEQSVALE